MNPIIVSGLDHPLVPYFVVHQLSEGAGAVVCVAQDEPAAMQLRRRVHAVLLQREQDGGAGSADALMAGLRFAAPALAVAACADSGPLRHFRFISSSELRAMFRDEACRQDAARAQADGAPPALLLVFDRHDLPWERSLESCMRTIDRVARSGAVDGADLHLYCMGAYTDDIALLQDGAAPAASPLAALVSQSVGLMGALNRRAPGYLARYPLRMREAYVQEIRLMPASHAAALLASAHPAVQARRHLVIGAQSVGIGAALGEIVRAAGGTLVTGHGGAAPDRAAALLENAMKQASAHAASEWSDLEASQNGEFMLHLVSAPATAMSLMLGAAREHGAAPGEQMRDLLAGTPLQTASRPGLRYYRYGTGSKVLLLVNAFGLPLDFWHLLASRLGTDCRVITLERAATAGGAGEIPTTCYSTPDFIAEYMADCGAVLDAEGIESCHVASWCSGAKLALELARAYPSRILSLSLLAPSFAGVKGFAGDDSAYEKNLFMMCGLVNKMPKTAASMAATMLQLMEKNSKDMERFDPGRKDVLDVLELADAEHLGALYSPFSSASNLVEFSRQLVHFRAHDIVPLLAPDAVQVPVMLVTGQSDTTTSNTRARDLCGRLQNVVGFDIEGSSHYLIHQDHRLLAELLTGFMREGIELNNDNPRVQRSLYRRACAPVLAPAEQPSLAEAIS